MSSASLTLICFFSVLGATPRSAAPCSTLTDMGCGVATSTGHRLNEIEVLHYLGDLTQPCLQAPLLKVDDGTVLIQRESSSNAFENLGARGVGRSFGGLQLAHGSQ